MQQGETLAERMQSGIKTYHVIRQLSNVLEEELHPFVHGLRVDGTL
jgi:hypothetical protein